MKKRDGIFKGLIAVYAACVILASGCSQSLLENNIGFTAGRTRATVAAIVALISLIIGGLALRSATRIGSGNGRAGAIVSLLLGLIVIVLSVVHFGNFTGGFGSGSGRAGAIVALVLALISIILGGLALTLSHRSRGTD